MHLVGPATPARAPAAPATPTPVSLADARAQLRDADTVAEAARAARGIREASFAPSRAAVQQVLEGAHVLDNERGRVGGMNGRIKWAELDGAGVTGHDVHAIIKRVHEQGAAEEFTWELAKTLGLHSYFPAVGRRPSGSAYMQRVHGEDPTWEDYSLADVARRWYDRHVPGLSTQAATAAARADVQLLHFVDYLIANSDRRGPNMLVDTERGTINWIDSGMVGMGDHPKIPGAKEHRLAPELQVAALMEPGDKLSWPRPERAFYKLGPTALETIATRLPEQRIRELHELLRDPRDRRALTKTRDDDYKSRNNTAMLDWIGSDQFLQHMLDRRAAALRKGGFHYTPFSS